MQDDSDEVKDTHRDEKEIGDIIMAKTPIEEPKYDCNEKIDGTKVYYYFNPPKPEQEDENKKDGIKKIIIGVALIILAIIARVKVAFINPVIYLTYIVLAMVAIGVIFIAVGAFKIKKAIETKAQLEAKKVSDEEYDEMERIMLQDIKEKGMRTLNLDEDEIKEADPLILHRYASGGDSKKGDDDKYRSTEHVSTVFYFTSDSLFVYKYSFSMKNKITSEETLTLFYTDIVSVLVGAVDSKAGEEDSFGLRQLTISSTGGQTVTYQFVASNEINASINAMQSLFRSKKKTQ